MNGVENTKRRVTVLGIDPAAAGPTGYGVVESDGRHCRMLDYGALRAAAKRSKESSGVALQSVHAGLSRLIQEFAPTVIAVESIFTALNMRTALRLAEVRGVVLLVAEQHGLAVYSYSPREVKASVAGYGHADKHQVQVMVQTLLGMRETPEPADAADALAVALCYLQREQTRLRFGVAGSLSLAKPRIARAAAATMRNGATRRPSLGIESIS
jgi:crossover junction endodeoxyribonuclease RuvC